MNLQRYILSTFFILVGLAFIIKLFYIQVADPSYKLSAKNNAFRHVTQYPARGMIFDRNGKLLVFNQASYDLKAVYKDIKPFDTAELCRLLEIDKATLLKQLKLAKQTKYLPAVISKQISKRKYAVLQEGLYKFPGFYVETRTLRKYMQPIAAHVLGYVGEVNKKKIKKEPYYRSGDYIGISGIERSYEQELRGKKGVKILVVDVHNREKGSYKGGEYDTAAVVGRNLVTTLDADLQKFGEFLMQNKLGSIVAIEPATGEILALVSAPSYNPNLLIGKQRSKNYRILANDKLKPLFNRAIKAQYPPGSTMKPVSALIALQEGVITENTVFVSNFGYNTGSHVVKDHIGGPVNFIMSIQHSSNAYYCNVFKKTLTDRKFHSISKAYGNWKKHLHSFGLGIKLGTDLAYEKKGLVYPASYFDRYYGKAHWNHNTVISLSIGQGELGFTPLQIANMTATVANRGYYITPHIIKEITGGVIAPQYSIKHYTKINKKYFEPTIEGMRQVILAGTARSAYIEGIDICGKTGTAQNPHGKDHSIFIAFAPRENPKIAIAVYVENAGYGSTWAAPIASLMIEKYLTDSISRPFVQKRIAEANLLEKK